MSESSLLDESTLDSQYHYRFIQERPQAVARARLKGFRIVRPSEEGVKTLFEQEDATANDVIAHGDRVLMKIRKSQQEKHRAELRERGASRLRTVDEQVKELARKNKIKVREDDDNDEED